MCKVRRVLQKPVQFALLYIQFIKQLAIYNQPKMPSQCLFWLLIKIFLTEDTFNFSEKLPALTIYWELTIAQVFPANKNKYNFKLPNKV